MDEDIITEIKSQKDLESLRQSLYSIWLISNRDLALNVALEYTGHENSMIRRNAAIVLGMLSDKRAVPRLVSMVQAEFRNKRLFPYDDQCFEFAPALDEALLRECLHAIHQCGATPQELVSLTEYTDKQMYSSVDKSIIEEIRLLVGMSVETEQSKGKDDSAANYPENLICLTMEKQRIEERRREELQEEKTPIKETPTEIPVEETPTEIPVEETPTEIPVEELRREKIQIIDERDKRDVIDTVDLNERPEKPEEISPLKPPVVHANDEKPQIPEEQKAPERPGEPEETPDIPVGQIVQDSPRDAREYQGIPVPPDIVVESHPAPVIFLPPGGPNGGMQARNYAPIRNLFIFTILAVAVIAIIAISMQLHQGATTINATITPTPSTAPTPTQVAVVPPRVLYGDVTGRVQTSDGNGIAGAVIAINGFGQYHTPPPVPYVVADASGHYDITGIAYGQYDFTVYDSSLASMLYNKSVTIDSSVVLIDIVKS
ncbi:MAG: hypothetical protein A4E28_00046 [Methanocella sp. PtaU1.Bin125]|nr:MAG: hypothetical protein A4E28_00046 [Methanocella sp. PtaU1.Bin125]